MNNLKARNKLIYLVPFIAIFIDVVVGTATLQDMLGPVAKVLPNKITIPAIATFIVILEFIFGSYKENKVAHTMGFIIILVVPALTLVEGNKELQNNITTADILGVGPTYDNIATVLKYTALSALSFASHYLILEHAKLILLGYNLYDPTGVTSGNIDAIEENLDEYFDAETLAEGEAKRRNSRATKKEEFEEAY